MAKDFSSIGYDDFRRMADDRSLTPNEKIGFPDEYRVGYDQAIWADICSKLPALEKERNRTVLDIGPGCAALPRYLIDLAKEREHSVVLVDSEEMLQHLPVAPGIVKVAGFFPECRAQLDPWKGRFDVILCYSVLHYIFVEANLWRFIDYSIELLADGGRMLIGDVPNVSKRKRFFSRANGIRFHKQFTGADEIPEVNFGAVETNKIDDAVVLGLIMRARSEGCDAYWLPQGDDLPMSNRREDILVCKP